MARRFRALAALAFVLVAGGASGACNALNGSGALGIDDCPGCEGEGGARGDGGADAPTDALAEGAAFDGAELPHPGVLDPTFGTKGVATSSLLDTVTSVVVRADGKIFVGGASGGQLAVARFDASGAPDKTFGGTGRIIVAAATSSRADALALDAAGRVVAAGLVTSLDPATMTTQQYAYAVRIGETALDTSFGMAGRVQLTTDGEAFTSVVVVPTGDIFVGGSAPGPAGSPPIGAVFHAVANGTLAGLGRAGITYVAGDTSTVAALSIGAADLVAVGTSTAPAAVDFGVARFVGDGADATFSGDGKTTVPVGAGNDKATCVGRLSNGTLIVGGETEVAPMFGLPVRTPQFGLVALQSSGAVATSWGNGGKAILKSDQFVLFQNAADFLRAILVDSSDRVLAVGYSDDKLMPGAHKIRGTVARLGANGRTDLLFGQAGSLSFVFEPNVEDTRVAAAAAQPDGKIVVAGTSSGQLGLARVLP
jgi:uncharacterized delta-60 repeat protein